LEGVVMRIRGGWVESGPDGLERSWNINSISVCVLPVCDIVSALRTKLYLEELTPGGPWIHAASLALRQNSMASF